MTSHNAAFLTQLAAANDAQETVPSRLWHFVPYDQLNQGLGLLATHDPQDVGIVLCETTWKPRQRPYHKQKLLLLLTSQRHFALEQARRGVAVRYLMDRRPYTEVLSDAAEVLGPLTVCKPAERELRQQLEPLLHSGQMNALPHDGWLTTTQDFQDAFAGKATWRMDSFYRLIRRRYDVLMDAEKKPVGGKLSHDADNRQQWRGEPSAPVPPRFEVNAITREVCELIEAKFGDHPGQLSPDRIPASIEQVEDYWAWVMSACLHYFGPYEDAMSTQSRQLFHTRISGLMNLHRLLPKRVVSDALSLDLPINSQEGLVRQILGWREYVRHVHESTDGLRDFSNAPVNFRAIKAPRDDQLGSSTSEVLPPVYWGEKSGLFCLDHVVEQVLEDAHTHHINRLMILSNWGTLLDVSPTALTDWFWVCFDDAYDWVVEPNVLGMGTTALDTLMVTKPYVSGSGYVNKMSDYCKQCAFNPKTNCPMTNLYWAFLERNRAHLSTNPRLRIVMSALSKRAPEKKHTDDYTYSAVSEALEAGTTLTPLALKTMVEALACS